jgi:hypothetical protein
MSVAEAIAVFSITEVGVPKLVAAHPFWSVSAVTEYVPTAAFVIVKVDEG